MPEFTHNELRAARVAVNMTQWEVAGAVGVSESTYKRWESGESKPTSSDVDRIGEVVNDPSLWHRWMCSNDDAYRKHYKIGQDLPLPVAVMRVGHMTEDITELHAAIERDAVDGKIDDRLNLTEYRDGLRELIARCNNALHRLE